VGNKVISVARMVIEVRRAVQHCKKRLKGRKRGVNVKEGQGCGDGDERALEFLK
jgi:hypothetical protein